MNCIFVISALLFAVASATELSYYGVAEPRLFEDRFNETFNKWIEPLKECDPIKEEHFKHECPGFVATFDDVEISGFSHQFFSHLRFDISILKPACEAVFEIPSLVNQVGHYVFDGFITGDGEFKLNINNYKSEIVIRVNLLRPEQSEFRTSWDFEHEFALTGLFHDEELSQAIVDFVNSVFEKLKELGNTSN